MGKRQSVEQFCDLREVIRNYIDYVETNGENPIHIMSDWG